MSDSEKILPGRISRADEQLLRDNGWLNYSSMSIKDAEYKARHEYTFTFDDELRALANEELQAGVDFPTAVQNAKHKKASK